MVADTKEAAMATYYPKVVDTMTKLQVEMTEEPLPYFVDFILSDKCGVQVKTVNNFIQCIKSGRLFEQARGLKEYFEAPVMLIVRGKAFSQMSLGSILGAKVALMRSYGVFLDTIPKWMLPYYLYSLLKYDQKPKEDNILSVRGYKEKVDTPEEAVRRVIEGLPLISGNIALSIYEHFRERPEGILRAFFNASEEELGGIPFIGKERKRLIRTVAGYVG